MVRIAECNVQSEQTEIRSGSSQKIRSSDLIPILFHVYIKFHRYEVHSSIRR
jgi:hypothetical protein